jgi:lysophospholipase L1-like esterase
VPESRELIFRGQSTGHTTESLVVLLLPILEVTKMQKSPKYRFLFPLLVAVGFVVLTEGSSFFAWKYFEKTTHTGVFSVKKIIEDPFLDAMETILPNPYSLYWNNPNFFDLYGKQYDDLGYRSHNYVPEENDIKILALGGSTTNAYPYVKDRTKIWTSRLEEMIRSYTGRSAHVFNAGIPNGTSAELMAHYLLLGRYLKPDIVIFHEGTNDIGPLMYPGYKTDYSHVRRATPLQVRPFEKVILTNSYFFRLLYMVWLRNVGPIYQAEPFPLRLLPRQDVTKMVENNPSDAFRQNVRTIVSEARSDKSKVLLVSFLQARELNLSKNRPDLVGLEKALVIGVEKHNRIMAEISTEFGQHFLKLDSTRFKDDWFLDNCHLNEEGEAEKASQIFEAVKPLID